MSKVKVAVVEDDFIISQDISTNLNELGYEVTGIYESGAEAISGVKKNPPDILLMDVNIKGEFDGIETAEIILKSWDIPFIYVTAYSDKITMERAKKTLPHAFIIKPFNFKNLNAAIELAVYNFSIGESVNISDARNIPTIHEQQYLANDVIYIKVKGRLEKVLTDDIQFIQAKGSYCDVIVSEKKYTISHNLQYIIEKLDSELFIRVHRSFAVNLMKISSIEDDKLLVGGNIIPIAKTHKQELLDRIKSM